MDWICVLDWGCGVGESVDFNRVLRYWVRYWDFWSGWWESGDFVGFCGIFDSGFYFLSLFIL